MELRSAVHHGLEMEDEEEASLMREVNGKVATRPASTTSGGLKKVVVLLVLAAAAAVLLLVWTDTGSDALVDASKVVEKSPVVPKDSPPKDDLNDHPPPAHVDEAPNQSLPKPEAKPKQEAQPPKEEPKSAKQVVATTTNPNLVYSKMSKIIPDPFHVNITAETRAELDKVWGKWKFWDGDETHRPDHDYCALYPNRDIPSADFPDSAWQVDAVYVNHIIDAADKLIAHTMEAMFTEYGKGKPLPPEGLAERVKMFRWDVVNLQAATAPDDASIPPKYAKKGDRGNGGWTTKSSLDGLVRRLLHAVVTNDSFTVVMGGHSAAAGHGNHFHQSYLMQFHKIVAPVLARLGVTLVTRNMAQGGLGTLHNAMGMGDIYGNEIDVILWDSGMTEQSEEHLDLFLRQAILSGHRVPVIWGGNFYTLKNLHVHTDADVGEYGTAMDGIPTVTDDAQALTLPYAARYMKCDRDRQDVCTNEPSFCAVCWIPRDDIPDPKALFPNLADKPGGQVKWHPGWRQHQLVGRLLAYAVLSSLQEAMQIFGSHTMGGPPLDEGYWHVSDHYANIRTKLLAMDDADVPCLKIEAHMPARMCTTPMQARTQFTPRANPSQSSITSILKAAPNGYKPKNEQTVLFEGPDVHNPCFDVPEGAVDVLAIVSGRRRLEAEATVGTNHTTARVGSSHSVPSVDTTQRSPRNRRRMSDAITPGLGWEVIDEPAGECNGEYNSICGRGSGASCPLLRHHDSRGALVGNEFSGWLVMELPNLSKGIIVLKLVTYYKPEQSTKTEGWTSVNNQGERRLVVDYPLTVPTSTNTTARRRLDLPETFQFEYAIDGKITTLSKAEFFDKLKQAQRVVELLTLLDDEKFTNEAKKVEVAIRLRGCGRDCIIGLSHIYWA